MTTTSPGEWLQSEAKKRTDPDTGLEFLQLTCHESENTHIYFHNPSFHPEMRGLIFKSNRSGNPEYYQMEWGSWRFRRISEANGEFILHHIWRSDGEKIRFFEGCRLVEVDWKSGRGTILKTDEKGRFPQGLSADKGSRVMFFIRMLPDRYDEYMKVVERGGSVLERVSVKPPCELVRWDWNLRQPEAVFVREELLIGHPQAHPLDPDAAVYAHCAPQLLDGPKIKSWLIRREDKLPVPISHGGDSWTTGHQFLTHDGRFIYDLTYQNRVNRPAFICIRSGRNFENHEKYALPDRHCHYHLRESDNLMVGDGAVRGAQNRLWEDFIYRIELNEEEKVAESLPLVRHGGFSKKEYGKQSVHPHPTFSPDGKWVIYNSCLDGSSDLALFAIPGS